MLSFCFVVVVTLCLQYYTIVGFHLETPLQASKTKDNAIQMHFEEAIIGNTKLTTANLPAERYLATNRFRVRENAMAKFEKRWAERKSRLATLPGFRFFTLLKRVPAFGVNYDNDDEDGYGNYISFTYWENKEYFDAWRSGEAFKEAHGAGGIIDFLKLLSTGLFILKGGPKPAFFDTLLMKSGGQKLSFATDNGWRSLATIADGTNFLPADIFVTQNKFQVLPGQEVAFENQWAQRNSSLTESVPGFVGFSLLRRDAEKADDGYNYIAHTIWNDADSFAAWRASPAFQASHPPANKDGNSSNNNNKPQLTKSSKVVFYEGKLTLCSEKGF
jgi:heme-degrading monooxygenase HmoA